MPVPGTGESRRGDDPEDRRTHRDLAAERARLGGAFVAGGATYARLRPAYPRDLVEWLVGPPTGAPVADIGAGTGKLAGVLSDLGHRVVAVEPSADMLGQLRAAYPGVDARPGTGEATGLASDSFAAACFGQSWHWVDPVAGTAEAARVLVAGGVLGLIWNFLDEAHPGIAAVEAAMHALHDGPGGPDEHDARVGAGFDHDGRREVNWSAAATTADLAGLVTTRSYYLARPATEQAYLRRGVAAAVEDHFGSVGPQPLRVPYRTVAHRYRRR